MKTIYLLLFSTLVGAQDACNGHVSLCSRPFNQVSYASTHNSYSYAPATILLATNQEKTIQQQLDQGIRAFMLDIARPIPQGNSIWAQTLQWFQTTFSISSSPSAVHLCHGICSVLDKGPLEDTLKVFARFMEDNPREVVTFIIENVGEFNAEEIVPSFVAAQLDRYAFVPSFAPKPEKAAYEWPTLAEMIERDQRLVVFIDNKADTERVPYILPEWEYMMEIPYANISPVSQFGCDQERPRDGVPRDLLVVNHFVYNRLTIGKTNIDSPLSAWQVEEQGYNSLESLLKHVDTCKNTWGDRVPNYIVLDYYNIGNDSLFKVVDQINGF